MRSKQAYILIAALVLLVLLISLVIVLSRGGKVSNPFQIPQASTQPSSQPINLSSQPLTVVATVPQNGTSVPADIPISFRFSKDITGRSPNITFAPVAEFSYKVAADSVFLNIPKHLQKNTNYTITIFLDGMNVAYKLLLITNSSDSNYGTGKPDAVMGQGDLGQSLPYVFLSNKVPHKEADFSVTLGGLKSTPSSHYVFIVTMLNLDENQVRTTLHNWLVSLGFNQDQENQLEFIYLTPEQTDTANKIKDQLPYAGNNFSMKYDKAKDATTIIIYNDSRQAGETEVDSYLKQNLIEDRYWINNLTIKYQ